MRRMNQLKEFREEAGMTVRELSERSGVSEDTITKIENGHRKGRSMTLRKLAKALGVTPHQLSPQQFDQGVASEFSSQESLVKPETASTSSSEVAASEVVEFGDRVSYALNVVEAVRIQSGLGAQDHLMHLTEGLRNVLLVLARNESMTPSEVTRQIGGDISATNRDLAILGEYGLVSRNESGENQTTPLGEGVAEVLSKGGLHYDRALEHVSTLMKAYESTLVFDDRPRRMDVLEAQLFSWLQRSVVQTLRDIVNVAEPVPDALTVPRTLRKQTSAITDDHVTARSTSIADLARALARKLGLEFVELTERDIDRDVVALLPESVLRRHRALPLRVDSTTGHLVVAMSDPSNLYALEDLRIISGYQITPVVATEDEIRSLQAKLFATGERITKILGEAVGESVEDDDEGIVSSVLQHAVGESASEIHIEPQADDVTVRFRVGGVLKLVMSFPRKLQHSVTARLKLLADLNIAEKRLPQDGRFSVKLNDEKINFRVAFLPTAFGEKVELRLLNTTSVEADLDQETTERANHLDSLRE
jgi:transcriptional regulator with XRE-family HTH domain/DNA-binding transcriptional ArsR family regulator